MVEPPVAGEDLKRQRVLEQVMEPAAAQGIPVEDLGYALSARAGVQAPERVPILLVECNEPELRQYKAELEEQLSVTVEEVLLEELEERVSGEEPPWRLAATTFYHVHEVERPMEPRGIKTVALLQEATLDGPRRLAELPGGTPVGWSATCGCGGHSPGPHPEQGRHGDARTHAPSATAK